MRILHVIPGLTHERGGPSAVLRALVSHQARAGHAVAVLLTDQGARSGERPVALDPAVQVERVPVVGPDRVAYAPRFPAAVRSRLREADVVHVHSIFTYPVHVALREARAAGVPVVLRPCGLLHRYSLRRSRLQKRLYLAVWGGLVRRACSAWHYTSANEAAESWPGDASPRFVLPNGIEPEEFDLDRSAARAAVEETWPELRGTPYVVFLSRLHPKKRLDLLLDAFLAGAPSGVKLAVAGPDECGLWPELAARYLRTPVAAARVVRLGTVAGPVKAALLAAASLFALPSEHENFGVAALEALATGTPVLLSPNVDLAADAVAAGVGTTAPLNAAAWRNALARALDGGTAAGPGAERARTWVRQHYTWGRIAEELTDRYRWVVDGCSPPVLVPAGAGPAEVAPR